VLVSKYISLNSVSKVLGIDLSQLTILNPSYKMLIVNGSAAAPKRLVIPQAAKEKYGALYNTLNADMSYNAVHENTVSYAEEQPTHSSHKGKSSEHKQ
jgi:membrane-bound lytic murein transglycosylase D